jgi:hypothetical protein
VDGSLLEIVSRSPAGAAVVRVLAHSPLVLVVLAAASFVVFSFLDGRWAERDRGRGVPFDAPSTGGDKLRRSPVRNGVSHRDGERIFSAGRYGSWKLLPIECPVPTMAVARSRARPRDQPSIRR